MHAQDLVGRPTFAMSNLVGSTCTLYSPQNLCHRMLAAVLAAHAAFLPRLYASPVVPLT